MSCGGQRPAAEVVQEVSITTLFFSDPIVSKNVTSMSSRHHVLMTVTTRGHQDSKIIRDMWLCADYPADQLGSLSVTEQEEQEQENTHSFSNWVLALNSLDLFHFCKSLYGQITKPQKKIILQTSLISSILMQPSVCRLFSHPGTVKVVL